MLTSPGSPVPGTRRAELSGDRRLERTHVNLPVTDKDE